MPMSTIVNKHLDYTYDNGWRYEFWLKSEERIVYKIHGGPMAGRSNYQRCYVQEVRTDEIYQISWLEETGTVVSIIVDLTKKHITTFMAFSKGHWEYPEEAHGDKRNPKDLERWRGLAKVGTQMEKHILPEQATLNKIYEGKGDLEDIDPEAPTL
ncbi:hypothetical protein P389DRAFT_193858 [Cystobasidium minutum MCA 4210]|uniref:uncharacterized protein n=1 Tax=Cystobasidium minutum MCA 4210 TaxID=1397322 RepID=UPI0034CD0FC1|eukprot:jgi/Rhomi1/193858/gm1.2072_g